MASSAGSTRAFTPRLSEGEVRVRVGAVGITALGTQVAGTIDAVGAESAGFARNDRVSFRCATPVSTPTVVVPERNLIGVPSGVSLDAAAAIFPCAMLARTVVKQVHPIGRGTRVHVTDVSVVAPFIAAWVDHLGATGSTSGADVVVTGGDVRAALGIAAGHGATQQVAADVFAAIRSGAFDSIALSSLDEARNGSRSPVLLHPADMRLAA